MRNILMISDYIEGQPVVASVRYEGMMKYFIDRFKIIVCNDSAFGSFESRFVSENYKFHTTNTVFTQSINDVQKKRSFFEKMIRNSFIMPLWRTYKYSRYNFRKKNIAFFQNIDNCLRENGIDCIMVTVPDVYGLYILEYVKEKYPDIPAIVEVRDIIDHNIGTGNPTYIYRKAEKIMLKYADGIIALSKGIYKHYKELQPNSNMVVIRNGYEHEIFQDSIYRSCLANNGTLVLAHVGSIYKGRNVKEFLLGLEDFYQTTGIRVVFNVVGVLDQEALEDINQVDLSEGVTVNIIGSVPHKEAIDYLKSCDISVIITHKKGSDFAIPGKTFEYIGACKPILAVTEDSELISFIDSRYGECAKHNQKNISQKLFKIVETEYNFSDRLDYSREKQVEAISEYIGEFIKGN
ncbi:hypothetical protein [Bacillus sp. RC51]|uniref:hypothetical protein n=1 Tax=Bacillus TaxID=1386 RepID=UPI00383487BE